MAYTTRQIQDDNFNFNSTSQTPLILYLGPQGGETIQGANGQTVYLNPSGTQQGQMVQVQVQAQGQTKALGTAALTMDASLDGQRWSGLGPLTGDPMFSGHIDVSTFTYFRVYVSTAEGSAAVGRVTIRATDAPFVLQ